jgi:DNA-binding winged helix-turn-helix (wHTH) protein
MEKITPPFKKFIAAYFSETLDLRVQSFNLLGFAGMAAGIVVALISLFTGAGAGNVIGNFTASLVALVLLRVTGKKLSYRASCLIIIVGVFMLLFPFMFFTAGGYRSGMPCFFVFALIFTAIMLEGKGERSAALILEFVLYTACCFIAYSYPETVTPFPTEFDYLCDVIVGITVSSVLLTAVVLLHLRMYRIRQSQIKELNRELEARNETLARQKAEATEITRGPLTLNIPQRKALVDGRDAELTSKEFGVLLLLVQNEDKELTGEAIYESVWGTAMSGDTGAVRQHISRLKKKLGEKDTDRFSILNELGRGYTFTIK